MTKAIKVPQAADRQEAHLAHWVKAVHCFCLKMRGFLYACTTSSNKIMCIWCYFYFIFQTYNTGSSQPYGSQECEQSRGLRDHLSSLNFLKSHFGQLFWYFWYQITSLEEFQGLDFVLSSCLTTHWACDFLLLKFNEASSRTKGQFIFPYFPYLLLPRPEKPHLFLVPSSA